ncbi:hypothetical protein GS966_29210 [Rhodococcus hoagii]|nr:hypothetical protein [Prescottella equi]
MTVDTENGLDLELDYNWETDAAGEVVEAYYRIVFTAHAGNSTRCCRSARTRSLSLSPR